MSSKTIYLLEDEVLIAEHLEILLQKLGYENVTAFHDPEELLEALSNAHYPDLVLLDIQLNADLDGVDVAQQLKQMGIPFVFLTSNSDSRTITRVKHTEPLAFIVKPFQESSIASNLEIAFHQIDRQTKNTLASGSVFVKRKHELVKIELKHIVHVEALDSYSIIYTPEEKYYYSYPLKTLEEKLGDDFMRIHRSHLVRLDSVTKILPRAVMVGEKEVPLSEKNRPKLLAKIETL